MMEAKSYRVKIVRGDREFEVEGDKEFVSQMLERYSDVLRPTAEQIGGTVREHRTPYPSDHLSVSEFIHRLGFKKQIDMVLGFAYYLEKYSGISEFTVGDIKNLYYEAKLESPNISQMIIQNIRRGYMMEAKAKGTKAKRIYTVTRSGEAHVSGELGNQAS